MGSYKLYWKESVDKDLRRIPPAIIHRLVKEAESLPADPAPVNSIKLKDTENTYRLRVGDYRIIYYVDHTEKEIVISRIRHRKDAYRV